MFLLSTESSRDRIFVLLQHGGCRSKKNLNYFSVIFCFSLRNLILHNTSVLYFRAFSVKLWYPQILQTINDYGNVKEKTDPNVCDILNSLAFRNTSENVICTVVSKFLNNSVHTQTK